VRKFIYVYVFNAHLMMCLPGVQSKQKFVEYLIAREIDYAIICPNGFFLDMSEFLKMAKSGTVYPIGDGRKKINPIHGADLAKVCADPVSRPERSIAAGGPVTYTYREVAELAFAALAKPPRICRIPGWLVNLAVPLVAWFSQRLSTLAAGMAIILQNPFEAPKFGTYTLQEFYERFARYL
jgi:uncharacterized protein YbjT (DUF2867 family)